ncbi:hypothetical protein [Paraburkholderia humisilvae]|uniref:ParB/Sulfiredoxin domain-containing protein n=1 Tax=Paraburkholderia humisilvae TaxID=627669 RepID=A0A6J5F9C3_9BURK|nr:hypothetical protein [Paraburkholderia humisilvae]CAB3775084.1 hypothetical protein LMG29542_08466 [Paraburkholderia humisilvae]
MRFRFPLLPAEFEIPDAWWSDAGMNAFCARTPAYRSALGAIAVPLREIEPPFRNPEAMRDWHGFDRERLVRILNGIAADTVIAPVPVSTLARTGFPESPFRYRIRDGLHRFYASVAAGFECLPVVIE